MRIVMAGASGLIGQALTGKLRGAGHDVATLVRRPPQRHDEFAWDPAGGEPPSAALASADAVVNLAGAGIGDRRWTPAYKAELRDSRLRATELLAARIAQLDTPPAFLNASAIGYYGHHHGDEVLDESSAPGTDFLAQLCVDWEAATAPAQAAGARVVLLRTGLVMSPKGGSFGRLLPLFKSGLAGRLGDGQMWWSWITLPDHVAAVQFLLETPEVAGPVNLTAPEPARNAELTAALASALHRPSFLPVPEFALKFALGEFSDDVLASARVLPKLLQDAGFGFEHGTLDAAARWFAEQA